MRISIVIVSLNGEQRLPGCLRTVLQSDWPDLEVIVVDNGSTDRTSQVVREQFPDVLLFRAEQNLGFAGGNNLGIARASGEIIVLLNDDCEPHKDWLHALANAAQSLDDWGILGCKLLYPGGKIIQHAGGILEDNALTRHVGYMEEDRGQHDDIRSCDYVTGAAFAIRRALIDKIGLLDPEYFPIYFEEMDYCQRCRRAGYNVYYIPAAVVIHHESMTTKRLSFGYLCKYHRNRLRFVFKNYDRGQLRAFLRRELSWFFRHCSFNAYMPLLLAYVHALTHFISIRRSRRHALGEAV